MRKTFFSIIILVFCIKGFSQFKQDTTIAYPDCIQFSPLFLLEPYTNCLNISWEHQYTSKIYFSGSLGYIFNETFLFDGNDPLEKNGIRLSFEVKRCLHRNESVLRRHDKHVLLGIEPYFKLVNSNQYGEFGPPLNDYSNTYGYSINGYAGERYLYTLKRWQAGCILKFILKRNIGKFSFNLEWGGRIFYKVVSYEGVQNDYIIYLHNRHDMFSPDYLGRFNNWTARPYLNVKLGRRF